LLGLQGDSSNDSIRYPASDARITAVDGSEIRPLRADARRNRDRVLEAARTSFGAEGSDVSLDEIARRAGVGAGTVYRHFPTKEALFEAVVFDRMEELVEEACALSDDPDPGRAFSSFVERLAREGARSATSSKRLPTTESTCSSESRRSSEHSLTSWPSSCAVPSALAPCEATSASTM